MKNKSRAEERRRIEEVDNVCGCVRAVRVWVWAEAIRWLEKKGDKEKNKEGQFVDESNRWAILCKIWNRYRDRMRYARSPTTIFLHVGFVAIAYTPDAHGCMCLFFSLKPKRVITTATINWSTLKVPEVSSLGKCLLHLGLCGNYPPELGMIGKQKQQNQW